MLASGIDVGSVKDILGHAKISMTMDVYGHMIPGAKARAISAIDTEVLALCWQRPCNCHVSVWRSYLWAVRRRR